MPKAANGTEGRVRILEKAVANLGDTFKKREFEHDEAFSDIVKELKAMKLFLGRSMPEFKKQFPEILRKIR